MLTRVDDAGKFDAWDVARGGINAIEFPDRLGCARKMVCQKSACTRKQLSSFSTSPQAIAHTVTMERVRKALHLGSSSAIPPFSRSKVPVKPHSSPGRGPKLQISTNEQITWVCWLSADICYGNWATQVVNLQNTPSVMPSIAQLEPSTLAVHSCMP